MGRTSRGARHGQGRTASRRSCRTHAIAALDTLDLAEKEKNRVIVKKVSDFRCKGKVHE
jgi:hypothetical protein